MKRALKQQINAIGWSTRTQNREFDYDLQTRKRKRSCRIKNLEQEGGDLQRESKIRDGNLELVMVKRREWQNCTKVGICQKQTVKRRRK